MKEGWDPIPPGFASHETAKPVRCGVCGQETKRLFQKLDGLSIGDPMCADCINKGKKRGKRIA